MKKFDIKKLAIKDGFGSELFGYKLISGTTVSDYIFVEEQVHQEVTYKDMPIFEILWQTGHEYYHGDYRQPSNEFCIYNDNADPIEIYIYDIDDLDDEQVEDLIDELSEKTQCKITLDDIYQIHDYMYSHKPIIESKKPSDYLFDIKTYELEEIHIKENLTYDELNEIEEYEITGIKPA